MKMSSSALHKQVVKRQPLPAQNEAPEELHPGVCRCPILVLRLGYLADRFRL